MFNTGDLVLITADFLEPHEPRLGIFWSDKVPLDEWGDQVAGECDCIVFWNEDFIPFIWENLTLLSEAP